MTDKEKLNIIGTMLELDEGDITLEMELDDIDEWDSMSKLYLVTYAKQKLNKVLNIQQLNGLRTIKDICDYIE